MTGLDLGLVNRVGGEMVGLQWGIIGWTEGDLTGWQNTAVSIAKGHMFGLQTGFAAANGTGKGVMWTMLGNHSTDFIGLQFGLINYAVNLHGIQIGLLNIIKEGGMLPFFPIFNFSFDE